MKPVVALLMSGGVDSTLAAYILIEKGYAVIGVHLLLPGNNKNLAESNWEKVSLSCSKLKIPCHLLDVRSHFERSVIQYFIDSYREGFTPNPCVICNKTIKFGVFFDYARQTLKSDFIASGHYARIKEYRKRLFIREALDKTKDQAYFLFTLPPETLEKVLFPLGDYSKDDVIAEAKQKALISDDYKESEDLCFIAGRYADYLSDQLPDQNGNIVDTQGKVLGKHSGIHQFTIGQRQGLQIAYPEPLYVKALLPQTNEVVVGLRSECFSSRIMVSPLYNIQTISSARERQCTGRVRYRSVKKPCRVMISKNSAEVWFDEPVFAVTPGQMLVLYKDDLVLGGGVIQTSE